METFTFPEDITLLYVTAASFPDGILAAHQLLHSKIPFSTSRRYFGVSRPEQGGDIVYRAAAEQLEPDEAGRFQCETLVLKKGEYLSLTLHQYRDDLSAIDRAFKALLSQPGLDPQGYCVEWYTNDTDMRCMIRKAEAS